MLLLNCTKFMLIDKFYEQFLEVLLVHVYDNSHSQTNRMLLIEIELNLKTVNSLVCVRLLRQYY